MAVGRLFSFGHPLTLLSGAQIVCILWFACSPSVGPTSDRISPRERVTVSGLMGEDTVWKQGRDYLVVGDVVVKENSVLTIEPNVHIFFKANTEEDYYGLIVKGRLMADGGDALHRIQFAPVRLSVRGSMEVQGVPGSWKGVWFESSADAVEAAPTVSRSVVRYVQIAYAQVGIKVARGVLSVEQTEVVHSVDAGILFNGSVWGEVARCTVRENAMGVRFELVKGGAIKGCVVENNREKGIECKTSSPDIEDNLIRGNRWGVYCSYGASPAIRWNTLVDQAEGGIRQFVDCFSDITDNLIVQHTGDGIVIGGRSVPRIGGNNLLSGPGGYAVRMDPGDWAPDVDAKGNYWGSGDPAEIAAKIYDGADTGATLDPAYYHARVRFEPFEADSIHTAGTRIRELALYTLRGM